MNLQSFFITVQLPVMSVHPTTLAPCLASGVCVYVCMHVGIVSLLGRLQSSEDKVPVYRVHKD